MLYSFSGNQISYQSLTDLNPMLKVLFSRNIKTIGELLRIATPRRLVTIRNTYVSTTGRAPENIEIISALVSLKDTDTSEIEIERVKSQIIYHQSSSENNTGR